VADVLADEVVAGDGDQVSFPDEAQAMQDAGHAQGDRRLAGARIARDAMCSVGAPEEKPNCWRARVTSRNDAISRMRRLTGSSPTRSLSSSASSGPISLSA